MSFIYPNRCGFCGEIIRCDCLVCRSCADKLETEMRETEGKAAVYRSCGVMKFDKCFAVGSYDETIRRGVLRLKYKYGENAARYLCFRLCDILRGSGAADECDLITFVPMNPRRKQKLGYNQAEIIAKILSKRLGIPIKSGLIKKNGSQISQHEQTMRGRMLLAAKSYKRGRSRYNLSGKTVLLCDDVTTSGATLSECAKILKDLGAKKVYCAVLAQVTDETLRRKPLVKT